MGIRSLRADSKCCNEVTPGIANIVWPVKWLTMSAFIYPSIRRILSRTGPTIWHQFSPMAPSSSSLLEKVRNLPPFSFYDQGEFENLVSSQSRFPESESPYATQPLSIAHPCPDKIQGRQNSVYPSSSKDWASAWNPTTGVDL